MRLSLFVGNSTQNDTTQRIRSPSESPLKATGFCCIHPSHPGDPTSRKGGEAATRNEAHAPV